MLGVQIFRYGNRRVFPPEILGIKIRVFWETDNEIEGVVYGLLSASITIKMQFHLGY